MFGSLVPYQCGEIAIDVFWGRGVKDSHPPIVDRELWEAAQCTGGGHGRGGAGKSGCASSGNATGRKAWLAVRAAPFLKRIWSRHS